MSKTNPSPSGVSSEAVARATGRDWEGWLKLLDNLGAAEMTHREIVSLVAGPGGLDNGWWQQSVAVGYEQARGLRVVGQTSGADFQIGVQRTLAVRLPEAWGLLAERPGRDAWLGECDGIDWRKGEKYTTASGVSGEIRSVVPGQRFRLTWCSPELLQPSTLQVTLVAAGDRTSFRFHQERLCSLEERESMRERWHGALGELEQEARQLGIWETAG